MHFFFHFSVIIINIQVYSIFVSFKLSKYFRLIRTSLKCCKLMLLPSQEVNSLNLIGSHKSIISVKRINKLMFPRVILDKMQKKKTNKTVVPMPAPLYSLISRSLLISSTLRRLACWLDRLFDMDFFKLIWSISASNLFRYLQLQMQIHSLLVNMPNER